jgi:hypothetical protein
MNSSRIKQKKRATLNLHKKIGEGTMAEACADIVTAFISKLSSFNNNLSWSEAKNTKEIVLSEQN